MNDIVTYLLVAIGATMLPSPVDPLNFYLQDWLYSKRQRRWVFEFWQIFSWYVLDALWFALLLGIVLAFNIQDMASAQAITTITTILGVGATISIVWRFLRKR